MPEIAEVETVRNTLKRLILNKKIVDVKIIYPKIIESNISDFRKILQGREIKDIDRIGKWLMFDLGDYYLLSHLRMEGKYIFKPLNSCFEKHEHVSFIFEDEELRYKDTRKFGRMYLLKKDELNKFLASKLGYEPWDKNLTIAYLKENLKNKTLPIKTLLLDQKLIAGIGNIYADEILFLSKINPHRKGKSLNDEELEKIIENTKKVLEQAIKDGGTTIRSYTSVDDKIGNHQNNLLVHKKENEKCLICKNLIKKDRINGRSTYYCSNCQK